MYTRFPTYFCFYSSTLKCVRHLSVAVPICAKKSHYDVLGLTPKATQSEVKAAYYELSKVYHPDKNQGSDAADQFRDITNAYEVLGNVKSRRLYDKGVQFESPAYRHPAEDDDPKTRFYRSREFRHRPPPPSGRQTVYDFDEWSRAHYGATFARDMERKRRAEFFRNMEMREENEKKVERVVFPIIFLTIVIIFMMKEDYDVDRTVYEVKKTAPKAQ